MKIIVILFLFLVGCTRSGKDVESSIVYFKDYKSGLCFAKVENSVANNYSLSITCVPCNNVNHLLEN